MTTAHSPAPPEFFGSETADLPTCEASELVELAPGETIDLCIAPVVKRLGDAEVRMLAYNGSIPGPTLRVPQGCEINVRVHNDADHETTVHWHGLRVDNDFDGVPYETQDPIPVGGTFTYRLRFPDDGVYWYHPHVREDYGLEMGLYGNILVDPTDRGAWPPVDREAIVTLDDVLLEDGRIAPFRTDGPTHTAMGRFGNVMLTGGTTDLSLHACAGDVVRFFLTNTANTRIFNVAIAGARMKLIGGDSGRCERDQWIDSVLLAPSERAIVDVQFPASGTYRIEHRTPDTVYRLGAVDVDGEESRSSSAAAFDVLQESAELLGERARLSGELVRDPDKTLTFISEMPLLYGSGSASSTTGVWTCPMHPEVISDEPVTCPKCGMKLIPVSPTAAVHMGMEDGASHERHHDSGDGLEWEDLMPEINARTDSTNMIWKLVDGDTGRANGAIDWVFRVGDRVKIRLVNTMDSDHPMHHPFHIHGAGRFLVLSRDDQPEPNLMWKDTVLLRAGETVDVLLDVTNPGLWMAHCHIAEHNQNGMMFSFRVEAS